MSRAKRQRQKENTRAAREAREAAQKRQRRKSTAIRVGVAVLVVALAVGIAAFVTGDDGDDTAGDTSTTTTPSPTTVATEAFTPDPALTYAHVTTNLGEIWLELDITNAPIAAGHFIQLAQSGAYDGSRWHRVVPDFVIQGGAPGCDLTAPAGESVVGELPTDNYPIGSLAAAKTADAAPGTFESQFFLVTGTQGLTLPNEYARFGKVASGIEVAQAIEHLAPAEGDGEPTATATIDAIEIVEPSGDTSTTLAETTTTIVAP
jgi:cyclophilin family peptidyl-prolyl cis-trans isomerase